MNGIQEKAIVITGGSSGIGLATAQAFAKAGTKVVIADIEDGTEAVREIKKAGGEATFVKTDVSQAADVQMLIEQTVETYGRLDFAVNNAGISGTSAATGDYTEQAWNRVISVNLTGVWLCMKYELEQMLKQGGGVIVNMASILGWVGFANAPAYVAAKHGVIGLTKTAAIEYAVQNIRVNAVCPAFIYTAMLEQAGMAPGTDMYDAIANLHPMKRMGKPEEVADLVLWLCSEGASFVTGSAYLVDGGYVAQ
ncbi:MAG: SDR family oxidoreductase [Anaerolineae bacterium]|nr:SDR family oxidoreductase [Anaerolineae bacterium]